MSSQTNLTNYHSSIPNMTSADTVINLEDINNLVFYDQFDILSNLFIYLPTKEKNFSIVSDLIDNINTIRQKNSDTSRNTNNTDNIITESEKEVIILLIVKRSLKEKKKISRKFT